MAGKRAKYPKVRLHRRVRSEGTYWTLRWTKDGRRHEVAARADGLVGYVTEAQAEEARATREAELRLNLDQEWRERSRPLDVVDLLVLYLEEVERNHEGTDYARGRAGHVVWLCRYFGGPSTPQADRLTTATLKKMVHHLAKEPGRRKGTMLSRETIKDRLSVIRSAYDLAIAAGHIDCEPPELPRVNKLLPDNTRPRRDLTPLEVRRLLAAAELRWGHECADLLEAMAWQPRRPKAHLSLQVRDCARLQDESLPRNRQRVFWRADKGGVARGWGPVTEPARRALLRQLERRLAEGAAPDDPLWLNARGGALSVLSAWERIKAAAVVAEVEDVTLYDLRKHGVGQLFQHTWNLNAMLPHTGHKDVRTLLRYLSNAGFGGDELAVQVDWEKPKLEAVQGAATEDE